MYTSVKHNFKSNNEYVVCTGKETLSDGPPMYNEALSQERAEMVVGVLEGEGVDPERLRAVGRGLNYPKEGNASSGGRFGNRRVEFLILEG